MLNLMALVIKIDYLEIANNLNTIIYGKYNLQFVIFFIKLGSSL